MSTKALKRFCQGPPEYGLNTPASEYTQQGFRFIRTSDIGETGELRDDNPVFVEPAELEPRHVLEDGDLLFSRSGTLGRCLRFKKAMSPATYAGYLVRFRPRSATEPRFLEYCSQASFFQDAIQADAVTSTISNFNAEKYATLPIPDPPLEAQRAIADYLDAETARIGALIAKKQQLIHLLDERRRERLFTLVVGADRSGSSRETKVPWAESLPSAWQEATLKLVAKLGSGHTPSRDHPEWWIPGDCRIPWVTTGEVRQMRSDRLEYLETTRERISEIGMANSSACLHPAGSVVLCRTAASAGYSAILATAMATSQDIVVWTCGPLLEPRYLLLCLRAMRSDLLDRLAIGSTHKTIYMPDIESIRVPLPSVAEQRAIVDEVWRSWHLVDSAVDGLERQMVLLAEHRQALITAAVTGEFTVPGAA